MDQVSMSSAYMWALVIMVVFFFAAVLIANMILYKPNNPGTTLKRIWFWSLCVASAVVGFIVNATIAGNITVPSVHSDYFMHSGIAAGVSIIIYILAGFIVSKLFPKSKVGVWF